MLLLLFSYNRTDFHAFFDYLTTSHETVISSHPNTEVLYLGDFNVHKTELLGSSRTDLVGRKPNHSVFSTIWSNWLNNLHTFRIVPTDSWTHLTYVSPLVLLSINTPPSLLSVNLTTTLYHLILILSLQHLHPGLCGFSGTLIGPIGGHCVASTLTIIEVTALTLKTLQILLIKWEL